MQCNGLLIVIVFVFQISAKMGTNVEQVLDAVVEKIPHPVVNRKETFKALLFDSW